MIPAVAYGLWTGAISYHPCCRAMSSPHDARAPGAGVPGQHGFILVRSHTRSHIIPSEQVARSECLSGVWEQVDYQVTTLRMGAGESYWQSRCLPSVCHPNNLRIAGWTVTPFTILYDWFYLVHMVCVTLQAAVVYFHRKHNRERADLFLFYSRNP